MHEDNGSHDEFAAISRRTAMLGALAAGAVATAITPSFAAGTANGDPGAQGIPADPAARAAIVRRMRYRTDAGTLMWWFRGRTYAQQGATLIPVCGLLFGSMMKLSPRADGGFDMVQYELGFRTDLETGKRLEKLRNPITGEMLEIKAFPVGPTKFAYSADNVPVVPATIGGSTFTYEHKPEQFWTAGDMLFVQYHARSKVETTGKPDRVINDMGMIYGKLADALNPRVKSAPAWIQGTDVTDYARWLNMPEGNGTQTLRSIGAKIESYEDMPADWRATVAELDPKMAANPMGVFDRDEATYKG